ncbi:DnaT-like ssDNA-binding domain-containing protein [Neisseria mucosa]|uniref:DnaT-like ssDNA-binding domain-containing protein n=2 Tax=Neisseria TaxID=482 RepID=UPI0027DFCA21|nr:DnaT-like ssDNA-binding domain-containing protein [Neisseria mucosa]
MMSIIRTKREHNYTVISNKVYEKNQLSWQAMGLLGYLLTKPDNWQVMVAELVNVTKDTKKPTGREGVYNIINELKEKGFISVRKNSDGSTDYTVYDEPIQSPNQGKPNQGKPNQAEPNQAEPNQAEPTLVNTDIQQVLKDSKDGDVGDDVPEASESAKPININIGDFAITDDWEPEDKKAFNAKLRRSQIPSLEDKRIKDALIEFTGYWGARGDMQTQAMWEHKFFQSLSRLKARGELGAVRQDPAHKRFETRTADGMPVVMGKQASELRPLGKF